MNFGSVKDLKQSERQTRERFLGSVLFYMRDARGMSANEMAAKSGVDLDTILAYERGSKELSVDQFCKIADILQIDSGDVLNKVETVLSKMAIEDPNLEGF